MPRLDRERTLLSLVHRLSTKLHEYLAHSRLLGYAQDSEAVSLLEEVQQVTPAPIGMLSEWADHFYYVAPIRRDGRTPTLDKAVGSKFYINEIDAANACLDAFRELGNGEYGVYEAFASIPLYQIANASKTEVSG